MSRTLSRRFVGTPGTLPAAEIDSDTVAVPPQNIRAVTVAVIAEALVYEPESRVIVNPVLWLTATVLLIHPDTVTFAYILPVDSSCKLQ